VQAIARAGVRTISRMNDSALKSRYLDLLEKSLVDAIYGDSERSLERWLQTLICRLRHPYLTRRGAPHWPARAHTMIGATRLHHVRHLVERTIQERIDGDYIETGVWRGGACIMMRGVLAAHGVVDRRVYCADTFVGLPRPDPKYPADKRDHLHVFDELAVSQEVVEKNFAAYGLLDDQVVFLKGLFAETLPQVAHNRFALIRLDGDMYGSTMDALNNLYARLSPAGFIIVDDYGGLKNCARAVNDFIEQYGLRVQIERVDESCVWWQKT
jgi:hypothetical protein